MSGSLSNSQTHGRKPAVENRALFEHTREYAGVALLGAAVFLFLCLLTYDPRDPSLNSAVSRTEVSNLCGLVGAYTADALVQILGICSLCAPLGLTLLAVRRFVAIEEPFRWTQTGSAILLIAALAALTERFGVGGFLKFPQEQPAGAIGAFLHGSLSTLLGSGGELILACTLIVLCVLHMARVTPRDLAQWTRSIAAGIVASARSIGRLAGNFAADAATRLRRSREAAAERRRVQIRRDSEQSADEANIPDSAPEPAAESTTRGGVWSRVKIVASAPPPVPQEPIFDDYEWDEGVDVAGVDTEPLPFDFDPIEAHEPPAPEPAVPEPEPTVAEAAGLTEEEMLASIETFLNEGKRRPAASTAQEVEPPPHAETPAPSAPLEPEPPESSRSISVAKRADEKAQGKTTRKTKSSGKDSYKLPGSDLLDPPQHSDRFVDEKALEENAMTVEQKLADLGVHGEVVAIHPGPVITMYELNLASGIPLRKVLNMADDLAMALKSGSTRIVAPIPGKDTVGIEVPNQNREIVYLREIVESPSFTKSKTPLKMAIGKGIDGEPFSTSLGRMPHLLIAGATGTGKSVGLNCLICSWLLSSHPDDVKLLMVDPKKLELSHYQDIPHLIHPVVTDPEKVPAVLNWAIREMERRYDLLSAAGAKNIESYNEKVAAGALPPGDNGAAQEKLPYIVIIVDELAELMMVAAKDIEITIARLAQMARASGIHLILATQRPSVDVITGVIKANFPARLSFQVSAKADSRTILDTVGAENLLGMGDLLFLPPGAAKLQRLHGAYISEGEIRRIVDFIKAQREPVYIKEISRHVAGEEAKAAGGGAMIDEEKYDEAVELVGRLGHASISLIQRHMRIGYNRAARIIEAMEAEGIIGPSDGTSRPREVLVGALDHIPDHAG